MVVVVVQKMTVTISTGHSLQVGTSRIGIEGRGGEGKNMLNEVTTG